MVKRTEVAQVVESLEVLDRRSGSLGRMEPAEVGFGYRDSALKRQPGRWVVLSVTMDLAIDSLGAPVRYAELAGLLGVDVGTIAGGRPPAAVVDPVGEPDRERWRAAVERSRRWIPELSALDF